MFFTIKRLRQVRVDQKWANEIRLPEDRETGKVIWMLHLLCASSTPFPQGNNNYQAPKRHVPVFLLWVVGRTRLSPSYSPAALAGCVQVLTSVSHKWHFWESPFHNLRSWQDRIAARKFVRLHGQIIRALLLHLRFLHVLFDNGENFINVLL